MRARGGLRDCGEGGAQKPSGESREGKDEKFQILDKGGSQSSPRQSAPLWADPTHGGTWAWSVGSTQEGEWL